MALTKDFRAKIRQALRERGMTQAALAERLGWESHTLRALMTKTEPDLCQVEQLLGALDLVWVVHFPGGRQFTFRGRRTRNSRA